MLITRTSLVSGIVRTLDIPCTPEQINRWQSGMLIQKAMPDLSADQREFLMTGITSEEWKELFNPEDYTPEELNELFKDAE